MYSSHLTVRALKRDFGAYITSLEGMKQTCTDLQETPFCESSLLTLFIGKSRPNIVKTPFFLFFGDSHY